jgi:MFS family permease
MNMAPAEGNRVPLVLLASLAVTGVGQTLLYALLPIASRRLGLTISQSSQIFALSALLWSLSSPFWGRLADRSGGVATLVAGMLGQAMSNLAVGLTIFGALRGEVRHAAVYPLLLVLRGINGMLGSAVLPSAQGLALRRAVLKPRIAVVGAVATAWTVGTMTGPGFAAALAPLGLPAPLLVAAMLAAVAAGVLGFHARGAWAPEPAGGRSHFASRMVRRRIWGFMLMQLAIGTAAAVISQSSGFFVQDRLGLSSRGAMTVTGVALSVLAACNVSGQVLAIRLRPAAPALIMGGGAALALAAMAAVMVQRPLVLIAAMGAMGAGLGVTSLGIATAASLRTRATQQGAVAGNLSSAGSLGAIVSALAVMPFYQQHTSVPYLAAAVLAGAVAAAGKKAGALPLDPAKGYSP